ncbi:MAG: YdcF family protein [Holophagaceae bacterium]|nr:YdcF family protein [Holophagaceae bacterium]
MSRFLKKPICWIPATAIVLAVIIDVFWFCIKFPNDHKATAPESLPQGLPLLVLGAGVKSNGEPTQVLEGRLQVALNLYLEKKVAWILVSGDNRTLNYNEPQAMSRWLIKRGVPANMIVSDYAGRRTYDSLKRARMVFGQEKIVVVTSEFHIARTLYLAKNLGLDAYGVPSATQSIGLAANMSFWYREYLARHKAVRDVWFPPSPKLGPMEDTPGADAITSVTSY